MNDSFGGGFNTTTTGQSENKTEGVLPMLIKQILDTSEDGVQLFGFKYSMITVVAIVRGIDHSATKIKYTLEDHTGVIDSNYWLEEGDSLNTPTVSANAYVRVIGSFRITGGIKSIMIFKIERVRSPNEVTTHLLEVMNARYKAEEYSKRIGGETAATTTSDKPQSVSTSGFMETPANSFGLTGKDLLVFNAIKATSNTDIGINRKDLLKKFPQITENELQKITEFMTTEGHIYTTIDSDHFLCID
uniref:Putative replication protein a2 n=1 Tax=Corethrella appendiculata TaxID=1370023 RepID=U5EWK3_9DIPT